MMAGEASKFIKSLQIDRDLVLELFVFFSRFEYSLKRSAFLMRGQQKANPDWETYTNSLWGRFRQVQDIPFRETAHSGRLS
jgi:hypothetical protein